MITQRPSVVFLEREEENSASIYANISTLARDQSAALLDLHDIFFIGRSVSMLLHNTYGRMHATKETLKFGWLTKNQ